MLCVWHVFFPNCGDVFCNHVTALCWAPLKLGNLEMLPFSFSFNYFWLIPESLPTQQLSCYVKLCRLLLFSPSCQCTSVYMAWTWFGTCTAIKNKRWDKGEINNNKPKKKKEEAQTTYLHCTKALLDIFPTFGVIWLFWCLGIGNCLHQYMPLWVYAICKVIIAHLVHMIIHSVVYHSTVHQMPACSRILF
jgi:hypothetical protein